MNQSQAKHSKAMTNTLNATNDEEGRRPLKTFKNTVPDPQDDVNRVGIDGKPLVLLVGALEMNRAVGVFAKKNNQKLDGKTRIELYISPTDKLKFGLTRTYWRHTEVKFLAAHRRDTLKKTVDVVRDLLSSTDYLPSRCASKETGDKRNFEESEFDEIFKEDDKDDGPEKEEVLQTQPKKNTRTAFRKAKNTTKAHHEASIASHIIVPDDAEIYDASYNKPSYFEESVLPEDMEEIMRIGKTLFNNLGSHFKKKNAGDIKGMIETIEQKDIEIAILRKELSARDRSIQQQQETISKLQNFTTPTEFPTFHDLLEEAAKGQTIGLLQGPPELYKGQIEGFSKGTVSKVYMDLDRYFEFMGEMESKSWPKGLKELVSVSDNGAKRLLARRQSVKINGRDFAQWDVYEEFLAEDDIFKKSLKRTRNSNGRME